MVDVPIILDVVGNCTHHRWRTFCKQDLSSPTSAHLCLLAAAIGQSELQDWVCTDQKVARHCVCTGAALAYDGMASRQAT